MRKEIALFAVSAVAISGCEKPAERLDDAAVQVIKTEIQQLENKYAEAINSKNVDSIMAYYADDAISFDSNSDPLYGKMAIRHSIEKSKGFPKRAGIKYTVLEVLPSNDGTQVIEIGHYKISDPKGINYGSGNYFSVFEKRGDKYVCVRDIQTPDGEN